MPHSLARSSILCLAMASAKAALTAASFDVVLMDRHLPGMDGLDATRRIREMMEPGPCIIGISAENSTPEREACLAAGMDAWLPKPFTVIELEQMMTRWCAAGATRDRRRAGS